MRRVEVGAAELLGGRAGRRRSRAHPTHDLTRRGRAFLSAARSSTPTALLASTGDARSPAWLLVGAGIVGAAAGGNGNNTILGGTGNAAIDGMDGADGYLFTTGGTGTAIQDAVKLAGAGTAASLKYGDIAHGPIG